MTKVLVLYYSSLWPHREDGRCRRRRRARGRRAPRSRSSGCPSWCREEVAKQSGTTSSTSRRRSPRLDELADYDAIIFGTPTRFGNMAAQMRNFLDQTGGLWMKGALVGKVGSVFTSTATQHGGQETTIISFHHHAAAPGHGHRRPALRLPGPDEHGRDHRRLALRRHHDRRRRRLAPAERNELDGARFQGKHVAEITARLTRSSRGADERRLPRLEISTTTRPACLYQKLKFGRIGDAVH